MCVCNVNSYIVFHHAAEVRLSLTSIQTVGHTSVLFGSFCSAKMITLHHRDGPVEHSGKIIHLLCHSFRPLHSQ